jgi:sugar lactone lactonase YvrE
MAQSVNLQRRLERIASERHDMSQPWKFFVLLALCANFAAQLSAQKLLPVSVAVSTNYQLNGVAVSHDDRIFVALPRWVQPDSFSLGEVKDGKVVPYPGGDWNSWHQGIDEENRFTTVNAVWVEPGIPDALWVVDCGQGVEHGKKLVKVDLKTNTVSRVYHFSQEEAPLEACLNDVRIAKGHAFVTESGLGAILTVDLKTGRVRRLLAASRKTKAVPGRSAVVDGRKLAGPDGKPPLVHADDIEISPDKNWLYFGMPMGGDLWKVKVDDLLDDSLDEKALDARVLDDGPLIPVGGIYMLPNGSLLLSDLEKHALELRSPDGKLTLLAQSKWLDSPDAMSVDKEGRVYIAASQAGRSPGGNHGVSATTLPFRVLRVTLPRDVLKPASGAQ